MNQIPRDKIDYINTSRSISEDLFNDKTYQPSTLQILQYAYNNPDVRLSSQSLLEKHKIGERGLNSSLETSQANFAPKMITSNTEMMRLYRYPISGTATNLNLSNERITIGNMLMKNSQAVVSGRLY